MSQDEVFRGGEGDKWFERNRAALGKGAAHDWIAHLLDQIAIESEVKTVLELGCSNGWRLHTLAGRFPGAALSGVDVSGEAIRDGQRAFPELHLLQGSIADVPLEGPFDLVVVHFVLHWVDRRLLARAVSEIDRLTRDGGVLILGDFLPDFQQRRAYHHTPGQGVFTYKQDYAAIFAALGTYREILRMNHSHDDPASPRVALGDSDARGTLAALRKSLDGYYFERK